MLDGFNKEASDLGLQTTLVNAVTHSEMDSLHFRAWGGDLTKTVGRGEDMSKIVQQLLSSDNEESLSVISIVGMAGHGKTTLAHLICENESVVRHFEKIIWVSVSDDFEVTRILSHMAEFLTLTNLGLSNEYALVEKLKEVLTGKRYLLVLDDVWNEAPSKWKSLKGALIRIQASATSKIIVTTRSMEVASVMEASFSHELKGLPFANGWTMFKQKAFAEGGALETTSLVTIGKQIVRRCAGVPLVIDVLGSLMYSKRSEDEWLSVKNNPMWGSIPDVNDLAISVIKLSYDHLSPSLLKNCFAYSSIFPKDSYIEKDIMVQLWMALGLLPCPTDSSTYLEDVGNKFFDTLASKSLLQEVTMDEYGNIEHCKMHDLVHDLAEQTSKGYCFSLGGDSHVVNDVRDDVVHFSLSSPTKENLARVRSQRLQTLFLVGSIPDNMLKNFKFLRVLVLIDPGMKFLPKSIGKMKQLRYLDIEQTSITGLPSSVAKLYNLQTLKVYFRREVPETLGNLVNLRHLTVGGKLIGVGKLTSLRTLPLFVVSRREGCYIRDLGGLIDLRGELVIEGIEDIESVEEAWCARLFEKPKLQSLKLRWSNDSEEDKYVLEGLRPHFNLRSLEIKNFKGVKLSSWMTSESFSALRNLVNIKLKKCDGCEQVTTLGHLQHLKKVELDGLWNVEKIGAEFYHDSSILEKGKEMVFFPALKELIISNMGKLKEWVDLKEVCGSSVFQFPKLEKFVIDGCEELLELPNSLLQDSVALEKISLKSCFNLQVIPDVQRLTSLHKLSVNSCSKLKALPRGLEMLTSLQKLKIRDTVTFVPDLDRLTSLQHLEMVSLSEDLDELPALPSSLQVLVLSEWRKLQLSPQQHEPLSNLTSFELSYCKDLESLPDWLWNLSSLQTLKIDTCPRVSFVPDLDRLTSLQHLRMVSLSEDLDELPALPPSLHYLFIGAWRKIQQSPQQHEPLSNLTTFRLSHCGELESLPDWLGNLSSLWSLSIGDCRKLRSLSPQQVMRRLTKLKELHVINCPLLEEGYVQGSGAEWHSIQHIPFININYRIIENINSD